MNKRFITATTKVTAADLPDARLGSRFGRMDLMSQLVLLAVEPLREHFEKLPGERVAICLVAGTGSLSTDAQYWEGRNTPGGFSPTLFTYTLPSAAIGELAIRHRLTGPHLCFVGGNEILMDEATDLIERGEVDACVCVVANIVSPALAKIISVPAEASATAFFVRRDDNAVRQTSETPGLFR